ncbi:MAG: lipopolysaccharide biosynthesis protein [Beijerinckiaceae bacterium]
MLLRQTLMYLPAQLLAPLFLFVAAVVWTHVMPPGPYGVLMFIMAFQELAFYFALSWWSLTVLRYRDAFDAGSQRDHFQRTETTILYISIVVQIAFVAILLPLLGEKPDAELIIIACAFVVTRSLLQHFSERARAGGDVPCYTVAQVAGPVVGLALGLIFTKIWGARPAMALLGYALAQAAILPWVWVRSGAGFTPGRPGTDVIGAVLRYGLPLFFGGLLTWVSVNGIRVVVEHLRGAVELGLISVGWGLGQRLSSTAAMLVTAAAFPLAVQSFNAGDKAQGVAQIALNGSLLTGILAPAAAGIFLINEPLVKWLVAEPYWAVTIAVLPLALLSGVLRNLRVHFADQVFLLHERTGWAVTITVMEAVATIIGCVAGVYFGGTVGAVAGATAAHGVMTAFGFYLAVALLGLRIRWGDMARIALATAVMSAGVWAVRGLAAGWPGMAIAVAVGAALYSLALVLLYPSALPLLRAKIKARRS